MRRENEQRIYQNLRKAAKEVLLEKSVALNAYFGEESRSKINGLIISRAIHVATNGMVLFFFYGWVIFHCIYVPHLIYPFLC